MTRYLTDFGKAAFYHARLEDRLLSDLTTQSDIEKTTLNTKYRQVEHLVLPMCCAMHSLHIRFS